MRIVCDLLSNPFIGYSFVSSLWMVPFHHRCLRDTRRPPRFDPLRFFEVRRFLPIQFNLMSPSCPNLLIPLHLFKPAGLSFFPRGACQACLLPGWSGVSFSFCSTALSFSSIPDLGIDRPSPPTAAFEFDLILFFIKYSSLLAG